jgi:hypothetical protein
MNFWSFEAIFVDFSERRGGVVGVVYAGINGFNAIEDGGGFKREIKGGK